MRKNFSYEYLGDRALIISISQGDINKIYDTHSFLSQKLEDFVLDYVKTPDSITLYNDPYKISVKDLSIKVKYLLETESFSKKKRKAIRWKIPILSLIHI